MVNIDAPPAASAGLCRYVCYPRVALKCAALRVALAFMGHTGGEGSQVGTRLGGQAARPGDKVAHVWRAWLAGWLLALSLPGSNNNGIAAAEAASSKWWGTHCAKAYLACPTSS